MPASPPIAAPRPADPVPTSRHVRDATHAGTPLLALAALGVVFGDIGTSPLYAFQAAFATDVPVTHGNVLGVLSLFFWSLVVVVTLKYVLFVMHASNAGEGGIMALLALALRGVRRRPAPVIVIGLIGVALFYGDGVITPAISVLSAVSGTSVATSSLKDFVVPLTIAILTGLFLVERLGTARVGVVFGPLMVVWFLVLGALGVNGIRHDPSVFRALDPTRAAAFLVQDPKIGFLSLGAVVLCVTGAEALYADMGHFGRRPIALAWTGLVLPCLALNYFGQGALVLDDPALAKDQTFFHLAPKVAIVPLVVLATIATVIASQAVISGAYSLTQQAVQLGYLPRLAIRHTSRSIKGQIYVPSVNWILYVLIVIVVLSFRSSEALASAYGIAVTGTMVTTTLLAAVVTRTLWRWPLWRTVAVVSGFLVVDVFFFAANTVKIESGGWLPLLMGSVVFFLMQTWRQGREKVGARIATAGVPLIPFLARLSEATPANRPLRTAVFLSASPRTVPRALLANLEHNELLHARTIIVWVDQVDVPRVAEDDRVHVERLPADCVRVTLRTGFLDQPDVPWALRRSAALGLDVDPDAVSYFLGRDAILVHDPGLSAVRKRLFAVLHRTAGSSVGFFNLPPAQVIEIGSQVVI